MVDQVHDTISIAAPAATVWQVILDFDAYPLWADAVTAAAVAETDADGQPVLVDFTADARVAEVHYQLRYQRTGDHLEWHLAKSELLTRLDGSYDVVDHGESCEVTYRLLGDIALPVPGFLKKRAARVILDTSLRGLERRVQQLQGA